MAKKKRRRKSTQVPVPLLAFALRPFFEAAIGSPGKYKGAIPEFQETGDMGSAFKEFGNVLSIEFAGTDMNTPGTQPFGLMNRALGTWISIGVGIAIHKFLGKKVNPYLKRIPFVGKYVGV